MKRVLVFTLAIIAVLVMSLPANAQDVGTNVSISDGSGPEPVILAKWETPDERPEDSSPATQIVPPGTFQGAKPITFWAIVFDNPIQNVSVVAVDVYHPEGPPMNGSFKYQVMLEDYQAALDDFSGVNYIDAVEAQAAIDQFNLADAAGLVTVNDSPEAQAILTVEGIVDRLAQGEAYLWTGTYEMYYHQPAGLYRVDAYAIDRGPVSPISRLENYFEYVPLTAFELDFTTIAYGNITDVGIVSGNTEFVQGDGLPTLRNLGNTWLTLQIRQDDMGFGMSQPGNNWNVSYDARVGSLTEFPPGGGDAVYFDPVVAKLAGLASLGPDSGWIDIPGVIHLCNRWMMGFSIHVEKAMMPAYTGLMQIRAAYVPFSGQDIPYPQ